MAQITYPDKNTGDQMTAAEVTEIKTVVNQNEAEIYNEQYNVGFTYNEQTVINQNGFYNSSGIFSSNAGFRAVSYNVDAVSDRVKILYASMNSAGSQLVCYMNESGELISREGIGTGATIDYSEYELTIPLNCAELRLTSQGDTGVPEIRIAKKVVDIAKETTRKTELSAATLNYEKQSFTIVPDTFYLLNGLIQSNASWKTFELDVNGSESDYYITQVVGDAATTQLAIYFNSENEVISRDFINDTGANIDTFRYKLNIPSNAVKVGVTAHSYTINKYWYLEKGINNAKQFTSIQGFNVKSCGDSITAGSLTNGVNYIDTLVDKIRPNWVNNYAASGATAMETAGSPKLADQIALIGSGNTSIIPIMIGVNDFDKQNVLGDVTTVLAKTYASLIDTASFTESIRLHFETLLINNPDSKIFALMPLNTNTTETIPLSDYRNAIRGICEYLSIPVIEAAKESGLTFARPDLFVDNLHPTELGQEILGTYISNEITKTFLV